MSRFADLTSWINHMYRAVLQIPNVSTTDHRQDRHIRQQVQPFPLVPLCRSGFLLSRTTFLPKEDCFAAVLVLDPARYPRRHRLHPLLHRRRPLLHHLRTCSLAMSCCLNDETLILRQASLPSSRYNFVCCPSKTKDTSSV